MTETETLPAEPAIGTLLANVSIFITDQSHECQRDKLPPDAIPGFAVSVYRRGRNGKLRPKPMESMWCRTHPQAEQMAQEYARQYATLAACGW